MQTFNPDIFKFSFHFVDFVDGKTTEIQTYFLKSLSFHNEGYKLRIPEGSPCHKVR